MSESIRIDNVLKKLSAGIIDRDTAARELGYEKAATLKNSSDDNFNFSLNEVSNSAVTFEKKKDADKPNLDAVFDDAIGRVGAYAAELIERGFHGETLFVEIDKFIKTNVPSEVADRLASHIALAWSAGADVTIGDKIVQAQGVATQKIHDAIDWFKAAQNYDYGKVYRDSREELRQAVLDSFNGIPTDVDEVIARTKSATDMIKNFGDKELRDRFWLVANNAVNKSRNFSQVLSYEELGFTELEIIAVLDKNTSAICRNMNGRRIRVSTAANYVRDVLATPADKVVAKFGWETDGVNYPKDKFKMRTGDLVAGMDCKLPPYHGNCRTTVGVGESSAVRYSENDGHEIEIQGRVLPEDKADSEQRRLNREFKEEYLNKLTPSELRSKIEIWKTSKWDEKSLEWHKSRHPEVDNYFSKSMKVLREPESAYAYRYYDKSYDEYDDRIAFVKNIKGKKYIVAISPYSGKITTCFTPNKNDYTAKYMRIE